MTFAPSTKKISFAGPWITQKEVDYVTDATRNGFYENFEGYTRRLERAVADYVGVRYALATHCGTLALHLSCASLDLRAGDEVICTDFSWVATAYSIAYTGATPVFVDIDPNTWTIDPVAVEKALTPKTRAIMVVHMFGQPVEMAPILEIARKHGLAVIEDAAPAMGATAHGKRVGGFGDFGCFSFHGAKLTVSGEGGILVTDDEGLYERAKLLASLGRTDSQAVFWSDVLGFQYTIANLTAALALAQVERIDELLARKREIFNGYLERLDGRKEFRLIREPAYGKANYCYPSLLLDDSVSADRDAIVRSLRELNVHCRPTFPRMSLFPTLGARFENPVATKVAQRGISLPSAANLDSNDIDFVCEQLIRLVHL